MGPPVSLILPYKTRPKTQLRVPLSTSTPRQVTNDSRPKLQDTLNSPHTLSQRMEAIIDLTGTQISSQQNRRIITLVDDLLVVDIRNAFHILKFYFITDCLDTLDVKCDVTVIPRSLRKENRKHQLLADGTITLLLELLTNLVINGH